MEQHDTVVLFNLEYLYLLLCCFLPFICWVNSFYLVWWHFLLQVFPLNKLQVFSEDELERLLCGEQDTWDVCIYLLLESVHILLLFNSCCWCLGFEQFGKLVDNIKFDHGYTSSSPHVINVSFSLAKYFERAIYLANSQWRLFKSKMHCSCWKSYKSLDPIIAELSCNL